MPSTRPASIRQAELWQGLEQLGDCRNPTLRWILHGFDENFEKKLRELKTTWNQKARAYYRDVLSLNTRETPLQVTWKLPLCQDSIQKSALAWCIRENTDVGMWGQDSVIFEKQLADDFAKTAFVDIWNEAMCFKLIGKFNQSQVHEGFWTALGISSTVTELMDRLGISDAELAEARGRLEERKQKQELQKKTVKVCGVDFVNSEENLNNLWDHILGAIEDDSMVTADLSDLEELKEQGGSKKGKKGNKKPANKKKPKGRMSQAMKDLVGLVGEIHAFRALQKFYGVETVGPSCWISENSRHKYPENTTDDGYGCDFVIHKNGKTHYVEVKATQAEDEAFELGSSEVELAIDSANRRKKEFVILHVLDALSDNPKLRLLPNPYDRKYRDKYRFEEAGLRVRYEIT